MRGLGILLIGALVALPALSATANSTVTVDFFIDGGDFQLPCEDVVVAVGATAYDALEACAARHGATTAYTDYGGDCFLDSVNGKAGESYDPSGFYLLGQWWAFRVDGVPASVGLCGHTVTDGEALSVGYEVFAAWFVVVPNAPTVVWGAQHLA